MFSRVFIPIGNVEELLSFLKLFLAFPVHEGKILNIEFLEEIT